MRGSATLVEEEPPNELFSKTRKAPALKENGHIYGNGLFL